VIWILISLYTGEGRHLYYDNCYTLQTKLLLHFTRSITSQATYCSYSSTVWHRHSWRTA